MVIGPVLGSERIACTALSVDLDEIEQWKNVSHTSLKDVSQVYMTSFGEERRRGKACILRSPNHGHTVSVDYSKMG